MEPNQKTMEPIFSKGVSEHVIQGIEAYKQRRLEGIFKENVLLGENQYVEDMKKDSLDKMLEVGKSNSNNYPNNYLVIPRLENVASVNEKGVANYGRSAGYLRKLCKESPEQLVISPGITTSNLELIEKLLKYEATTGIKLESGIREIMLGWVKQMHGEVIPKMYSEETPKYGNVRRSKEKEKDIADNCQRLVKMLSEGNGHKPAEPNGLMYSK